MPTSDRRTFLQGAGTLAGASLVKPSLTVSQPGCELLICTKDRGQRVGDPVHDTKIITRGDVILAKPLGTSWGECERRQEHYTRTFIDYFNAMKLTHEKIHHSKFSPNGRFDFWRIVRFPNVRLLLGETLLSPELPVHDTTMLVNPLVNVHTKGFFLDIDRFPIELRTFMDDDSHHVEIFTSSMSESEFRSFIRGKRSPFNREIA